MKCTNCHAAEPGTKYRGEVTYWYKGHTTSIHGVNQYVCLRCGSESLPPGHVQRWLEQTALFRAEIDAQKPDDAPRPESLKDKIMIEWLSLVPGRLADGVQARLGAYIRWEALANYAKQQRDKVFEAFAGYKGSHTADRPGCAYLHDWMEFIDALRKAREIVADPHWELPRASVIHHYHASAM